MLVHIHLGIIGKNWPLTLHSTPLPLTPTFLKVKTEAERIVIKDHDKNS